MTERRGDQGFSVAPRRLGDGPGSGRSRRLRRAGVAIVVAIAAGIFTIAWLGPRLSDRPNFELSFFATPTPRPGVTPTPTPSIDSGPFGTSRPTPLPAVTRTEGAVLSGRIGIAGDGFRVIDLATGTVGIGPATAFGRDAIVRAPSGAGWICVCFDDGHAGDHPVRIVRILTIGPGGEETGTDDVLALPATVPDESRQGDPSTDVDIRADRRRGLLASANRIGNAWRLSVVPLDLDRRSAGPTVELGVASLSVPTPSPSPPAAPSQPGDAPEPTPNVPADIFLDGPHVRISPDGRVAFVWGTLQVNTSDAVAATAFEAWRVELDGDGAIGSVAPVRGLDGMPGFCNVVAFAAADRLAWLCPQFPFDPSSGAGEGGWVLGTVDLEGRRVGGVRIPTDAQGAFSEPLFDRANGQVYAWDPTTLQMIRIDVHALTFDTVAFDPAAAAAPGTTAGHGSAPPDWRDADSAIQQLTFGQLAAAPDGSRLYALGFDMQPTLESINQASRGIFAIDRSTLALVGRWAPAADYMSVSVTTDGLVVAAAIPGADAGGHEAPWDASLTIHDPVDGRILVRFGQLGSGLPPLIVDR